VLPALVLTAGLGKRLDPITRLIAKPAVPLGDRTLVERVLAWLERQQVRDLVLNLHHRPESITAAVGDGGDLGARVRYSWESPVLGSAGGPRHALPLLLDRGADETFVLVNGDTLTNVDLRAMIDDHRRHGALVTMALIPNPRPDKYGGVRLNASGAVARFTKRRAHGTPPAPSEAEGNFHFIGPQIVQAEG